MSERQWRSCLDCLDGNVTSDLTDNRQIEQLADEEALLVRFWGEPVGLSMAYDRVVPRATGWRAHAALLFNAFLDVERLRRDEPRAAPCRSGNFKRRLRVSPE